MPLATTKSLAVPLVIASILCSEARAQEGYRLDEDRRQIVAESQHMWDSWNIPAGTMTASDQGLQPRCWKLDTNATLDILDFLQEDPPGYLSGLAPAEIALLDAVEAGSNREGVLAVVDGDPATYWEPDRLPEGTDVPAQWWFTIDLGRVVVADRIVLEFVDEDLGDPFYVFEVLTADGTKPVSAAAGQSLDFESVLQVFEPNTIRREFEISLTDLPGHSRGIATRFVQVVVRGSRLDRGVEIDADEYARLQQESPEEVGAVDFMKVLSDGTELSLSEDSHGRLPDDKRGPIRRYRRERPRLAELEVWVAGEDLANHLVERGGGISSNPRFKGSSDHMFDGDVITYMRVCYAIHVPGGVREPEIVADLGSTFWVRGVRWILRLLGGSNNFSLGDYQLEFSDGSLRADGSLLWVTEVEEAQVAKFRAVYNPIPTTPVHPTRIESYRHSFDTPIKARFMRLVYEQAVGDLANFLFNATHPFSELRLFSEGYQPEVTIESPLMDPQGTRTLTSIEWDADTPAGTELFLQTRTSQMKSESTRFYNRLGEEVDSTFYAKNLFVWKEDTAIPDGNLKGDVVTTVLLGSDASEWSEPYFDTGARITSPSPRKFVQIRATLLSDTPDTAATLNWIRLNYTEPLALSFLGEMTPTRVESLAVVRPFSLYIRPEFGAASPGFDGLLLKAPDGMNLDFTGLYAGAEPDLVEGADLEALQVQAQYTPTGGDSLLVTFPVINPDSDASLIRLDFTGELFSVGGRIEAFARFRGDDGIVWQQVDEGDAAPGVDNNSLVVVGLPGERQLFADLDLPGVFSPNGDGVNDVAELAFSVVLVGRSRAVSVDVFDLSGRLVRQLDEQREVGAGSYRMEWDGSGDDGRMVPPGIYALRLHVDADDRGANLDRRYLMRTIAVVY